MFIFFHRPEREKGDILTMERMRLFIYRAVSNPAYICQTEEDPILKAFELSAELNREATFDKEFYPNYKALSKVSESLLLIEIHRARQSSSTKSSIRLRGD